MKITLIGAGNVASHLAKVFHQNGHTILEIAGRSPQRVNPLAKKYKARPILDLSALSTKSDIYILAIPDHEIPFAAKQLNLSEQLVVHTSGSVSLSAFPKKLKNTGVFYPLQTFTEGIRVNYSKIPVCIEASNTTSERKLKRLAESITKTVKVLDSSERAWLHLTAVMVNNFSNHLFTLAEELLKKRQLSFDLLRPLIAETAEKVMKSTPSQAQTGPAKRGDTGILQRHLEMLEKDTLLQAIYLLLSNSIEEKHGPRL
jgi:pyrroline-5-carboxylate reductase